MVLMTARDRRLDRALTTSRRLTTAAIAEIRDARIGSGLGQEELGRAVGISASQVARFERGALGDLRLEPLCRLSAGVGLAPHLRFYPDGDPIRDAGQVRLLDRLRVRVAPSARWRVEVPLHGQTDARAWDAIVDGTGCVDAVEAETRLRDLQATERKIGRKLRDDPTVEHVVLLVADTRTNRLALAEGREALRVQFPLDTRVTLGHLANGRCPGASAIVVI
jgi:transcriptional regulator with XRE-family HTH domain